MFSYQGRHKEVTIATLTSALPPPPNCHTDLLVKIMKQKPVLDMLPKPFSAFVRLFDFHSSISYMYH